jgi:hypothetical protein
MSAESPRDPRRRPLDLERLQPGAGRGRGQALPVQSMTRTGARPSESVAERTGRPQLAAESVVADKHGAEPNGGTDCTMRKRQSRGRLRSLICALLVGVACQVVLCISSRCAFAGNCKGANNACSASCSGSEYCMTETGCPCKLIMSCYVSQSGGGGSEYSSAAPSGQTAAEPVAGSMAPTSPMLSAGRKRIASLTMTAKPATAQGQADGR